MPELRATDIHRDRFYMDYINTWLEWDVKDLGKSGSWASFMIF